MKTIEQLQEENAALMAQVEALRGAIEKWQATDDSRLLADALAATPQHQLRKVRAEVVLKFVSNLSSTAYMKKELLIEAKQYAESIRQGEVE